MPSVDRLYAELGSKGLEVLLVNFREDPAHVQRVVKERGYRAPVLIDRGGDVTGRVYGVWGPPTVYLVDHTGVIRAKSLQDVTVEELVTAAENAIK